MGEWKLYEFEVSVYHKSMDVTSHITRVKRMKQGGHTEHEARRKVLVQCHRHGQMAQSIIFISAQIL